ncbi:hypothetical protein ACK3TF_005932 [Chlorella vulgaris]
MTGHKAAFARLRVVAIDDSNHNPCPSALLWQGRSLTIGKSAACVLDCGDVPLASRCHAILHAAPAGVFLSDTSANGTLALEGGSSITWDVPSLTAAAVDGLPWCEAQMLTDGAAVQLGIGQPVTWLMIVGLHRNDWLAGARAGMSAEINAKGAILLMYEQYGAAATIQEAGALEAVQLGAELNRLPFARTPGSAADGQLHCNDRQRRHARIRDKYGDERQRMPRPAPLHQAFNIFQAAAAAPAATDAACSKSGRHPQERQPKRARGTAKHVKKRSRHQGAGAPGNAKPSRQPPMQPRVLAGQGACEEPVAPVKQQARPSKHAEAAEKENRATAEAEVRTMADGCDPMCQTHRAAGKQRRRQVLGRMGLR